MQKFGLWLDFELFDKDKWDNKNGFCNIQVELVDGRSYCLNIWTYKFFQTSIINDRESGDNLKGMYQIPPDLFVEELSRKCIEQVISDLLERGELDKLLNPGIFISNGPEKTNYLCKKIFLSGD